jgi:molybdenum cofactor cytidylyltransferase
VSANEAGKSFGVAILAAGASSRMGRPKMLLPWGTTTVLGHLIAMWRNAGAVQIAVVCSEAPVIRGELDRLDFPQDLRIVNSEPARGMFSSIQCASRWNGWQSGIARVALVLGDQPHLASETLRTVTEFAAQHLESICQPSRNGRGRHPVFLPRRFLEKLAQSECATMKDFLAAHAGEVQRIELNDAGLDLDIDTPADYEEALRRWSLSFKAFP